MAPVNSLRMPGGWDRGVGGRKQGRHRQAESPGLLQWLHRDEEIWPAGWFANKIGRRCPADLEFQGHPSLLQNSPVVGFIAGKGCDSWERGRPARTRLGRVVAIGFTGLVGSPADWRRGSAFTRMRAGRPLPGGNPWLAKCRSEFCKRLILFPFRWQVIVSEKLNLPHQAEPLQRQPQKERRSWNPSCTISTRTGIATSRS